MAATVLTTLKAFKVAVDASILGELAQASLLSSSECLVLLEKRNEKNCYPQTPRWVICFIGSFEEFEESYLPTDLQSYTSGLLQGPWSGAKGLRTAWSRAIAAAKLLTDDGLRSLGLRSFSWDTDELTLVDPLEGARPYEFYDLRRQAFEIGDIDIKQLAVTSLKIKTFFTGKKRQAKGMPWITALEIDRLAAA